MAFLDEDDSFPPVATDPDDPHRMPPERQRIFMLRRLGAVAVGILILILLVLGIRGCLNARKERAFENYARDLSTVSQESQQLSEEFFNRFEDPGNLTALNFETEIRSDRSQADGLDASDVYLAGRRLAIHGTVYGTTRANLFDRLQQLRAVMSPTGAFTQDRSRVVAVTRTDLARAEAYARQNGIARAYATVEELCADPEVNVPVWTKAWVSDATPENT